MTPREVYDLMCQKMKGVYDDRESATIARYLIEDVYGFQFWDESNFIDPQSIDQIIQRLQAHEPWQYIGGEADFYGLKFKVNPSVLIPRPETEELVYNALNIIKKYNINSVMDIGTGSGIIPITIAKKSMVREIIGLDISTDALNTAQANGKLHNTNIQWIRANFLDESKWALLPKVDLIISNPPYIDPSERINMDANVLHFEPWLALFVNHEPLEFYRSIINYVITANSEKTWVIVEINEKYGDQVCQLFVNNGFSEASLVYDLQGKHRIVQAFYNI